MMDGLLGEPLVDDVEGRGRAEDFEDDGQL